MLMSFLRANNFHAKSSEYSILVFTFVNWFMGFSQWVSNHSEGRKGLSQNYEQIRNHCIRNIRFQLILQYLSIFAPKPIFLHPTIKILYHKIWRWSQVTIFLLPCE